MHGILTIEVLMSDGTQHTLKYPKYWTTRIGKCRVRETCLRSAMDTYPKYASMTAKWNRDITTQDTTNGDITFEAEDLDSQAAIRFIINREDLTGVWLSDYKVQVAEQQAAVLLNDLRRAGLEVVHVFE